MHPLFRESVELIEVSTATANLKQPDLLVYPIGYEARSVHVARQFQSAQLLGLAFDSRRVFSYQENLSWATARKSRIIELSDDEFWEWSEHCVSDWRDVQSLCIDVSSFSRDRIGRLIEAGCTWLLRGSDKTLTITYAPGSFSAESAASVDSSPPMASAELLRGYEGSFIDTEESLTAIVGLGYEAERALGAIELIEAPLVTVFLPFGIDGRFDTAAARANASLIAPSSPATVQQYDVMRPLRLYDELVRLLRGTERVGRATLIPLGPKIFAAVSCLAHLAVRPSPAIWRVSSGWAEVAREAHPAGPICGIQLRRTAPRPALAKAGQ